MCIQVFWKCTWLFRHQLKIYQTHIHPVFQGKSVDTEDESPTSPSSSFGNVTPVSVTV